MFSGCEYVLINDDGQTITLQKFDPNDSDDQYAKRFMIIESKNCETCGIRSYTDVHCEECNFCVTNDSIHCENCQRCYPSYRLCCHLKVPKHPLGDLIASRQGVDELMQHETNVRTLMKKTNIFLKYAQNAGWGCNVLMFAIKYLHFTIVQRIIDDIQQLDDEDKISLLTKYDQSGCHVPILAVKFGLPASCLVSLIELINKLPPEPRLKILTKQSRFGHDAFGYANVCSPEISAILSNVLIE